MIAFVVEKRCKRGFLGTSEGLPFIIILPVEIEKRYSWFRLTSL